MRGRGSMSSGTSIRVGADLVMVSQVEDSIATFGDRYVRRVYTEHEIDSCGGPPSVVSAGLAARFAAKEATIKVLRPRSHQPEWRSIEVRRHRDGWCRMVLSGYAAELASQAGLGELAVSLTHEQGIAGAVVIALCRDERSDASLSEDLVLGEELVFESAGAL